MNCKKCGSKNPPQAKFCMSCGNPISLNCKQCLTELPLEAKFCFSCGFKIDETGNEDLGLSQYIPKELMQRMKEAEKVGGLQNERRVVTILFCDLEGSTAAASMLDPEEWTDIMNGAFEYLIKPVYKYEGVLARLMGDAILAFFGAPIAHEDDPERAILTGLDILDGIKPYLEEVKKKWKIEVNTRIGINTGLVVVGEIGSDMRVEYSAMGDAVNLASRMESTATPGTIQISENTQKLVAPHFNLKDLGKHQIKGKSTPIHTYQVLSKKDSRGTFRRSQGISSSMVGRDRELVTLTEQIQSLSTGKGKIISLTAEAGIGKSRLVHEIYQDMKDRDSIVESISELLEGENQDKIIWLQGRSLSYQSNTPYAPIVDLFSKFFEINELNTSSNVYSKLKERLDKFDNCEEISPFIANLLQIEIPNEDKSKIQYLDPPSLKIKTQEALVLFLTVLASNNPIAVIVDDLQWIDSSSFDFVKSLFELSHREHLLILGIYRPKRDSLSWEFHSIGSNEYAHIYNRIEINRLNNNQTKLLVKLILQADDLPEEMLDAILHQSDGNPFYVEEVLKSLIDQNLIFQNEDGKWKVQGEVLRTSVPNTLVGVLTSRLDQLDPDSKHMAQIASVIGRIFRVDILNDIYDGTIGIAQALGKLEKRDMIEIISRIPFRVYNFKHALFHEIVYNSLLLKTRRELHKKIAKSIQKSNPKDFQEIARHYYEATDFENAFPYLVKAATVASQAYSSNDSIQLYNRAKDILDFKYSKPEDIQELYLGLGKHYSFRGQFSEAIEIFEELLEIGKTVNHPECQVSALNQLGYMSALILGDLEMADKYLIESEEIARNSDLELQLAECFMIKCNVETVTAQFENLENHLLEAVKIGEKYKKTETVLYGRTHVSNTLLYMTKFDEAAEYIQDSITIIESEGNKRYLSELKSFAFPMVEIIRGNLYSAHNSATEGMQMGREIGYAFSQLNAGMVLIDTNLLLGRFSEVKRMIEFTFKVASTIGIPGFIAFPKSCYLTLFQEIGDVKDETESIIEEIEELMENDMGKFLGGRIWTTFGFYHMNQGNLEKASELFERAKTEPNTLMYLYRPVSLIGLAYLKLQKQNFDAVEDYINEISKLVFDKNMRYLHPQTYQLIGDFEDARGNQPKCLENYEKGENHAEDMGMKPTLWKLKASIARSYTKAGLIEKAQDKIKEAKKIIDELSTNFENPTVRDNYIKFSQRKLNLNNV